LCLSLGFRASDDHPALNFAQQFQRLLHLALKVIQQCLRPLMCGLPLILLRLVMDGCRAVIRELVYTLQEFDQVKYSVIDLLLQLSHAAIEVGWGATLGIGNGFQHLAGGEEIATTALAKPVGECKKAGQRLFQAIHLY
jgi:hypothetical protein